MSIIRCIALMAAAALLSGTAQAQFSFGPGASRQTQRESYVSATAKASTDAYKKGESFYIAVEGAVKEGWHGYFRNPGSIGMPMEATLQAPEGFTVEGPFWAAPHRSAGVVGVSYAYEKPLFVWKVTPGENAPAQATFRATLMAQVCCDTGCADPEEHSVSVSLTEGEPATKEDWQAYESRVEVLGDAETALSATSTATEVVITFTSAEPVESAYFFSEDNSTSPTADQTLTKTGNTEYTLTIPRNDNSDFMYPVQDEAMVGQPLPAVNGILTFGGKLVRVAVGTSASAAEPAADAETATEPAPAAEPASAEADEEGDEEEEEEEGDDEEEEADEEEAAETPAEAPTPAEAAPAAETPQAAQPTPAEDCYVTLSPKASTTAYKKGESFYIAITGDVKETWHAYYRNPATFGEAMTATLQAPAGFQVEGPFWGVPHREVSDIGVGFIYEHPVVVWKVTPAADAPQQAEFTLTTQAQVCSAIGCMPAETHVDTLTLTEGEPAPAEDWQAWEAAVEVLGDTPTSVTATSTDTDVTITFTSAEPVESAYFFSDDNSTSPTAEQTLTKTGDTEYTLTIPRNDNSDVMQPVSEAATPYIGQPLPVISGILTFGDKHIKLPVAAAEAPAPSETATTEAGGTAAPAEKEEAMGFWALAGSLFLGGLILNLMPCVFPVIGLKVMSFVELGGGSRGKVFAHSMIFAFGILLSFWILSLLLVIGSNLDVLAETPWTDWFSVIINDAGSDARNWASWMQNPWVVYLILLLLLVLGLSMYGVFEIGVGATGVGQGLQQKKGLAGSFFQGFLVTVVATPCSGPFLGVAMPAVMALPGMMMVLGLTFMALGLASPYILLGAFPSLVSALPRPGEWMESLKQGLSFLLFAAAAWMLYTYTAFLPEEQPIETLKLLWAMVGVCCAFWVYGRWCPIYRSKTSRIWGLVAAVAILAASVYFSYPGRYTEDEADSPAATEASTAEAPSATETGATYVVAQGPHPVWNTWSQALMDQALADGHPVFVDFTAKWCMTCQSNKQFGYNDGVYAEMERAGVVLMRADKTKDNPEIDAAMRALNRSSVPVNALYISGKTPIITKEVFTSDYLLEFLQTNLKDL